MNRSILIVICDFIITSMIYLNGGFSAIESPFRDGGGATIDRSTVKMVIAELEEQRSELERERLKLLSEKLSADENKRRDQKLAEVTSSLAATRAKIEFMERRARLSKDTAGPLSPAELQKELEAEISSKNMAKAQLEQLQAELKAYRDNMRKTDANLETLQSQHAAALRELSARGVTLANTQAKLNAATGEVAKLGERLASRDAEISRQAQSLSSTRQALDRANVNVKNYRQQLSATEANVAYLQGRSSAMEKELAATRDRLSNAEQSNKNREIELSAAKTRLENMQNVLKNAVTDLSRVRSDLSKENSRRVEAQRSLAKLQGEYKAAVAKLQNAEEKLRSDVLTRYTRAAVRLNHQLREDRLIGDRRENNELFLPAVRINGQNYLISALRTLTAARPNSSAWGDVTDLAYRAGRPEAAAPPELLSGPMLVLGGDCRVAMLPIPGKLSEPLTLLTKTELKRRGIQDLYLFKVNSYGKDSTILDTRCSMSFESDDDYLYIRNGARVSSELKAEVGDLVLTKQGELAAVVVALEEFNMGRQVEARCYVFDKLPDTAKLPTIELKKPAGQIIYRDFVSKLNFWLEQARKLDAKKRRR